MINAFYLPSLVSAEQLAGRTVVVIDVLRATTTITWALAAGAREVIPFEEVEAARQRAAELGPNALTGGERGGRKIAGFDLGNSPAEYTPDRVAGKTICFTTTNGTRAMQVCRQASRVLLGAFVNLSALNQVLPRQGGWDILCAGTDGQITREDVLLAGALLDAFQDQDSANPLASPLNDQANMATELWRATIQRHGPIGPPQLTRLLAQSHGGRNLVDVGHADDIGRAAQLDRFTLVPQLDPHVWRITPANSTDSRN